MGKKYSETSDKQRRLEDPAAVCTANALVEEGGTLAGTMSVDEYFDTLIDQVRKDYEAI